MIPIVVMIISIFVFQEICIDVVLEGGENSTELMATCSRPKDSHE